MKHLVLHVGTHKTGTTALQRFFADNRALLSRLGVHYPDVGKPHHAGLAWALRDGNRRPLLDVLGSPEASRHDRVLLSSEDFERQAAALGFVREMAPRVTVVIYLRRQDHYVQSIYQECVKSPDQRSTLTFAEYYQRYATAHAGKPHQRLDWSLLVRRWAEVFGSDHVVVRPFERNSFAGGSIFADFLGVLGLSLEESFVLPPRDKSNIGFPREMIELLRGSNAFRNKAQQTRIVKLMGAYAAAGESAASQHGYDYLSPAQRIALLEQVDEGNRSIAREYLRREDGRLFLEPWPDPASPWQEHAFDLSQAVPTLLELIVHLNEEVTKLRQSQVRRKPLLEKVKPQPGYLTTIWHDIRSPREWLRRRRDVAAVAASGLFDAAFYRSAYPDVTDTGTDPVAHYVRYGWLEGRDPSARFNTARYLRENPVVAASGRCPLVFLAQRSRPGPR